MREDVARQVGRMADLAWAAGVLDARGQWVALPRRTKKGLSYTMRVRVRTSPHDTAMIERLQEILGGTTGTVGVRREWQVSGAKGCLALVRDIGPYLVQRGRRAQAHAAVCERIVSFTPAGLDRTVPAEELAERSVLLDAAAASGVLVPRRLPF